MQQERLILLVMLGALLALFGIITMQYMLVLIVLVGIVLILVIMDIKKWIEEVDKIAAGNRSSPPNLVGLTESVTAARGQISRIEERLDALERTERK